MNWIAHITVLAQSQADEGGLLQWLLGVDRIDPTSPDVVLDWQHRVPLWAWALIVFTAIALAMLSYRRMTGHRVARGGLAAVRAALLLIIAATVWGLRGVFGWLGAPTAGTASRADTRDGGTEELPSEV